jgi:hypothetical protein
MRRQRNLSVLIIRPLEVDEVNANRRLTVN